MVKPKAKKEIKQPSLDAQERLAEILNDTPHLVNLNGTEWEVRALRFGTQHLIAQKAIEVKKNESKTFGDVLNDFSLDIPAVLDVITFALLNDKNKIFLDGDKTKGYSDLFKTTRDTLEWDCDVNEFGELLFEVLNLLDVSFFFRLTEVMDTFRMSVTMKKRMRTKTEGQK